jgi:hypothetical protein
MMRAHARAVWSWARFDGPHQAGRRTALLALALVAVVPGVSRAYQVDSAAEIVPAETYALQPTVVDGALAAVDGVGRAWLAVFGWVPEVVAMALLTGLLLAYYGLAVDWLWPHVRAAHQTAAEEAST